MKIREWAWLLQHPNVWGTRFRLWRDADAYATDPDDPTLCNCDAAMHLEPEHRPGCPAHARRGGGLTTGAR